MFICPDYKAEFALEDDKYFVLRMVNMQWRGIAIICTVLQHRDAISIFIARDAHLDVGV